MIVASDDEAKNEAIKACVAYNDYLEENRDSVSTYLYAAVYLDNDNIPELHIGTDGGNSRII